MKKYQIIAAAGLALGSTAPGYATAVSALLVPTALNPGVSTIADDVSFTFSGLGMSDGGGGTLEIIGQDMDLGNDARENMVINLDSLNLGQWVCSSGASAPAQFIPGATGANFCNFSLTLSISGADLENILSDSDADLLIAFGSFVNVNPRSQLQATLSYSNAPLAPVPLPAGGLLLVSGIAAFAWTRRRSRAA